MLALKIGLVLVAQAAASDPPWLSLAEPIDTSMGTYMWQEAEAAQDADMAHDLVESRTGLYQSVQGNFSLFKRLMYRRMDDSFTRHWVIRHGPARAEMMKLQVVSPQLSMIGVVGGGMRSSSEHPSVGRGRARTLLRGNRLRPAYTMQVESWSVVILHAHCNL